MVCYHTSMSRRTLIILAVTTAIIVTASLVVFMRQEAGAPGNRQNDNTLSQDQAEAIEQAKAYRTDQACTDALTPATHSATGARYTFPSGCLAPGWVAD